MVERPTGIRTGRSGTFRHIHSSKERSRDQAKCYNQRNLTRRLDKEAMIGSGYDLRRGEEVTEDGAGLYSSDLWAKVGKNKE